MTVNKGIKMRIKPNAGQRRRLEAHFGANRWLWNYFLEKRTREYKESKRGSTYNKDAAELTRLKHDGVHDWLNETSVPCLQRTLKHLDGAYRAFVKGNARFPRFKSKKRGDASFTLSSARVAIRNKRVYLFKFTDGLKFDRKLPLFIKINNITISRVPSGKYYAVLSVEAEIAPLPSTGAEVGIDLGLKDFAVCSDGTVLARKRFTERYADELRRAQQHLARKKKGSLRRNKQKLKVANIHEKIANSRLNFLHQASARAVKNYDVLYLEDLAVKNMVRNRNLAKSISDAGWSEFIRQLEYKCSWYGKELRKIGRFYPSSKTCGECGFIHQDLRLSEREWKCPKCGEVLDRDLNAATNILAEGRREFGAAITENRRGDGVRPKQLAAKASVVETLNPEAMLLVAEG